MADGELTLDLQEVVQSLWRRIAWPVVPLPRNPRCNAVSLAPVRVEVQVVVARRNFRVAHRLVECRRFRDVQFSDVIAWRGADRVHKSAEALAGQTPHFDVRVVCSEAVQDRFKGFNSSLQFGLRVGELVLVGKRGTHGLPERARDRQVVMRNAMHDARGECVEPDLGKKRERDEMPVDVVAFGQEIRVPIVVDHLRNLVRHGQGDIARIQAPMDRPPERDRIARQVAQAGGDVLVKFTHHRHGNAVGIRCREFKGHHQG
ncbi:hypothetical protein R77564_05065 [Ralstonia sp. LMG 32965]|uniref:Uncharacterized protein n=1 Tax=Ralstonia flatus TaxID=3058601 RepID=A0ABM9L5B2_9RALS|nr:hypothetical protein R77564_05065 [Ralstonia sp. LMG 32965]